MEAELVGSAYGTEAYDAQDLKSILYKVWNRYTTKDDLGSGTQTIAADKPVLSDMRCGSLLLIKGEGKETRSNSMNAFVLLRGRAFEYDLVLFTPRYVPRSHADQAERDMNSAPGAGEGAESGLASQEAAKEAASSS